ncbi:hypothetical protein QFZ23_002158 [Arthrobacter globiformis]|uniref:hypothetical protein n=1 Tax=Arthrobacter globiformis TaxID=1665 RepID=UPI002785E9EA|nr:hypothetical protein [Arthrobacter globiformis]MDQ1058257.1 hypothetical protein [Arthrobacter globiformis]
MSELVIMSFFSSQRWQSWDLEYRPVIPEGMPVLVDDDLLFEDGPAAPRPATLVNRWKAGLSRYAERRAAGPVKGRFAATTWGQHMSILSLFYRWAIDEEYASAEPFTYRSARALFAGTGRKVKVNLAVRVCRAKKGRCWDGHLFHSTTRCGTNGTSARNRLAT